LTLFLYLAGTAMTSNPLATMSRKGYLTGVNERLDRQLAYYLTSDLSQTTLYQGSVRSFQGTIQQYNDNITGLQQAVEADLTALYSAIFDAVVVSITVNETSPDGTNRLDIVIDVIVTDAGVNYSLGQGIQSINGVATPLILAANG
jgi:hypothetical protein